MYFDFNLKGNLDIDNTQRDLGVLYQRLLFMHIYKVLENEEHFGELQKDGWFPFIELISRPYKRLSEIYQNKFNFDDNIKNFIDSYDQKKIESISKSWWNNSYFKEKENLIKAGLRAYYQNDKTGFIQCIKTLTSEIEGIIRFHYYDNENKPKPTFKELISYVVDQGKTKGRKYSLFLPLNFMKYLEEIFFSDFDLSSEGVPFSRHSTTHGVANEEDYGKIKALQTILVLDQLYFYLN